MNKKKTADFLKISLHGMDFQKQKTMSNYIKQISKDTIYIVHESESNAEIFDIDLAESKKLLQTRLSQKTSKPVIVLSINDVSLDNVIYVKKPITIPHFLDAIKKVQTKISRNEVKQDNADLTKKEAPVQKEKPAQKKDYKSRHIDSISIHDTKTEKANKDNSSSKTNKAGHDSSTDHSVSNEPLDKSQNKISSNSMSKTKTSISSRKKQILAKLVNEAIKKSASKKVQKPSSVNHLSINTIKTIQHDNGALTLTVNLKQKNYTHRVAKPKSTEHSVPAVKQTQLSNNASSSPIKGQIKAKNNSTSKSPKIETDAIDQLLQELNDFSNLTEPLFPKDNKKISVKLNRRKTIRYFSEPIEAKLKKKSLTNLNKKNLVVKILNISSKGALIKLQKPAKMGGRIILTIQFPFHHDFIISARIVRNIGTSLYGLQFMEYHHGFTDYLVKSGRSKIHI